MRIGVALGDQSPVVADREHFAMPNQGRQRRMAHVGIVDAELD